MRLFLDAHISGQRVGGALRGLGHDVVAAGEQRWLDSWPDEQLLELATQQGRVFVTFDAKDLVRIVRVWAEAQRAHAGCLILVGMDHSEFGTIIRAIDAASRQRPDPEAWRGYTAFVSRGG